MRCKACNSILSDTTKGDLCSPCGQVSQFYLEQSKPFEEILAPYPQTREDLGPEWTGGVVGLDHYGMAEGLTRPNKVLDA
jgi:hypothetical protein